MAKQRAGEPPFQGGAQPVKERRAEVPREGRSLGMTLVVAVGVLTILAAVLWLLVPLAG